VIEDHVTNLELSQKLKELGVKQDAFWSWYEAIDRDDTPRLNRTDENCPTCCLPKQSFEEKYSAFLASELGERLPNFVSISLCGGGRHAERADYLVCESQSIRETWIRRVERGLPNADEGWKWHDERDKKLSDALAKMLIYLIENKLLEESK